MDTTTNIAMIPIHLGGLFLSEDQLTTEAHANFNRLPYHDNGTDIDPDTEKTKNPCLF